MKRAAQATGLPRLAYVHIAKSAGNWLRAMLEQHYQPDDICNFRFQPQFDRTPREEYIHKRLFCAHMTHATASTLDAELITVLRNPFDRIVSLYSYWHQVDNGPGAVKAMTFDEFLETDHPGLSQDIDNAQTWQLAFGHTNQERRAHADISADELLRTAVDNLSRFAVVGIYEDLPAVSDALNRRFALDQMRTEERLNATPVRPPLSSLTIEQRRRIFARTEVDLSLYDHVVGLVRSGHTIN